MSSTRPTPAEQHLGDRLAALVDGELAHDARDRVLAHLATCPKCKAEADAQRRLKSVFAHAAPPPPPEGLLARLQGLPAGPGGDDGGPGARRPFGDLGAFGGPGSPFGGGFGGDRQSDGVSRGDGVRGALRPSAEHTGERSAETFGHVPAGTRATVLPGGSGAGFRIHETGHAAADRSPWRGRRLAFAAASAVSFAAIALGGTVSLDGSAQNSARGEGRGTNITPPRTAASNTAAQAASNASPSARSASGGAGRAGVSGSFPGGATSVRGASEADRRRNGGYGAYDVARSDGASPSSAPTRPGRSVPSAQQTTPPLAPLSLWSPLSPNRPFDTSMLFGASMPTEPSRGLPPAAGAADPAFRLANASGIAPSPAPVPTHPSAPGRPGDSLSPRP
ncbi:anti-sigma factor family protein [Streptomyces sp. MUM 178J]|uniref:anti-sigma factor family protein n=1 Tax=Streptomyces sp. MUM 178J TaxID=2791991 RepID=UPI001F04087D|nr:anti-sigma factor [Streptomyces sp. MUM 178J]WRQ81462.1 anti-sigma factor [Streptomyces sp. MUM 178J]